MNHRHAMSRYHADRARHMGSSQSPTCETIVSHLPVTRGAVVDFPFELAGWTHHAYLRLPTAEMWEPWLHASFLVGIAMAEAYRLAEICTPQRICVPWYPCAAWEAAWWNEDIAWYLQQKFYLEHWSWDGMPQVVFGTGHLPQRPLLSLKHSYLLAVSGGKESTFAYTWLARAGLPFEACTLHFSGGVYLPDWEQKFPIFDHMRSQVAFHELRYYVEEEPAEHFGYQGMRNDPTITHALFAMMIVAAACGHRFLTMANDQSANEANAIYEDRVVNHQSAKGSAYILHFNRFLRQKGLPFRYVSLCENVYSFGAVAQLATWWPEAVACLTSCNEAQWQPGPTRWCHSCPKCAFSYALIEACTDRQTAIRTVGDDLLLKPELARTWRALFDPALEKPFECVGAKREVASALHHMQARRLQSGEPMGFLASEMSLFSDPALLRIGLPSGIPEEHQGKLRAVLGV